MDQDGTGGEQLHVAAVGLVQLPVGGGVDLGLVGIGRRIMVWIPLPITMAMFAGSILGIMLSLVEATVSDVATSEASLL